MVMLTRTPKERQDLGKTWRDCFLSTSPSYVLAFTSFALSYMSILCWYISVCIVHATYYSILQICSNFYHESFQNIYLTYFVHWLYGVCLPWSLSVSLHIATLNIPRTICIAASLSDMTGCCSAVWYQSCPPPPSLPHRGIDSLFQLPASVLYIIDSTYLYQSMAVL